MSQISVTAFAAAAVAKQIKPKYLSVSWKPSWASFPVALPTADFADDASAKQAADLLGGTVIQLDARTSWQFGVPNSNPNPAGIPQQNFIGFANQPGAPVGALLVVNAGDILQQAGLGWSVFPQQETIELATAYLITGAVTSQAAAADFPGSPFAGWPPVTPIYFTPAS